MQHVRTTSRRSSCWVREKGSSVSNHTALEREGMNEEKIPSRSLPVSIQHGQAVMGGVWEPCRPGEEKKLTRGNEGQFPRFRALTAATGLESSGIWNPHCPVKQKAE